MAKITKSHPNSKRKGVKKEPMPYIIIFQILIDITPDGYEVYTWHYRKDNLLEITTFLQYLLLHLS